MKVSSKWLPRTARRARKPLKKDWKKQGGKTKLIMCSYKKCLLQWMHSGMGKWAKCPSCGNYSRIASPNKVQARVSTDV